MNALVLYPSCTNSFLLWTVRSSHSTMVICGTAGQQVQQSCTRGMIHTKIHLISVGFPHPSIALHCRIMAWNPLISFSWVQFYNSWWYRESECSLLSQRQKDLTVYANGQQLSPFASEAMSCRLTKVNLPLLCCLLSQWPLTYKQHFYMSSSSAKQDPDI